MKLSSSELAKQPELIPRELTGETGKTVGALSDSRHRRYQIIREFDGVLPESIMLASKGGRSQESDLAVGSYDAVTAATEEQIEISKGFAISGRSVRHGALSQFPQNIGKCVVLLYTDKWDQVIDPFAGHNSRMELCVREQRHYLGYDLSAKFMQHNRKYAEILQEKYPDLDITLVEGDSREMYCVEDELGDFTLTSPPYYNLEDYGDEDGQLGKLGGYYDFLDGLGAVARENFRVLKPGAFCVWFVNDFRLDGSFHPYHIDTFNLLCDAGFEPWDMMIVDLGTSIKLAFASQIVDQKILPKRHEYGIVMRKPLDGRYMQPGKRGKSLVDEAVQAWFWAMEQKRKLAIENKKLKELLRGLGYEA